MPQRAGINLNLRYAHKPFTSVSLQVTRGPLLVSSEEGTMAVYQYLNEEHELAQVVVGGHRVDEVPPHDLRFFMASPEEEMEVYIKDRPRGSRRLVESDKAGELASRVRLM
jgi:hypothetical protein